jgi:catechol-2,3-dioxygenase
MSIRRMNHAVLYVRNAERTAAFYREVLGFREVARFGGAMGIFLQAPDSTNDHDIAFFTIGEQAGASTAGTTTVGLYHVAWEVGTLADLREMEGRLREAGALVGATDHTTTKALYAHDPDGLEFEVSWLVPADRITPELLERRGVNRPLDLDAELALYGPELVGGP